VNSVNLQTAVRTESKISVTKMSHRNIKLHKISYLGSKFTYTNGYYCLHIIMFGQNQLSHFNLTSFQPPNFCYFLSYFCANEIPTESQLELIEKTVSTRKVGEIRK